MSVVRTWESLSAFLSEFDMACPEDECSRGYHWDLGLSRNRARECARTGDESLVAEASDVLSRVATTSNEAPAYRWTRGIQGARVDVAAYLAGSPACFKRRARRPRDVRYVRVFVCLGSSGMIPAADMLRRGAYILGLVEALLAAQVRVDLYVTYDGIVNSGEHAEELVSYAIKLEEPVNLSTQGFALGHPAFARHIVMSMREALDGVRSSRKCESERLVREAHSMAPSDVYVPWAHGEDPHMRDPERWLRERISQLVGGQEG